MSSVRYDWEWIWGERPEQGIRGGESFRTKSEALWHGQRARAEMMRFDQGTAYVRPKGTLDVIEAEPAPHIYISDY